MLFCSMRWVRVDLIWLVSIFLHIVWYGFYGFRIICIFCFVIAYANDALHKCPWFNLINFSFTVDILFMESLSTFMHLFINAFYQCVSWHLCLFSVKKITMLSCIVYWCGKSWGLLESTKQLNFICFVFRDRMIGVFIF